MIKSLLIGLGVLLSSIVQAQEVNWLSFEQLDTALASDPKPVMIVFYTDWCTYCKKMEREVFTHNEVIDRINNGFYAVKFDAEYEGEVQFDGGTFIKAKNESFHSMAMTLATNNGQFTPPAIIFLNKEFEVGQRIFSYQSRKKMLQNLSKHQ
jgi:thioredoxin-related protein